MEDTSTDVYTKLAHGAVLVLDALAVWVIDLCPKVATTILLAHIGICLAYLSLTLLKERQEKEETGRKKQD